MNRDLIFRKVGGIISEISEQYAYLATNPESINPLELELLIANSHFLSEHLSILKKMDTNDNLFRENIKIETENDDSRYTKNNLSTADISGAKDPENIPADSGPDHKSEEIRPEIAYFSPVEAPDLFKDNEIPDSFSDERAKINVVIPEEFATPITASIPTEAEPVVSDPAGKFVIETILSSQDNAKPDSITDRVPTLNEILSAGMKDKNAVPKVSFDDARDLKSMIKLNDKLLFVRDLFNGYSLAYSEAIEILNRFDKFEAADNFLKQSYANKNRWSEKQSTVDHFYEILQNRFN